MPLLAKDTIILRPGRGAKGGCLYVQCPKTLSENFCRQLKSTRALSIEFMLSDRLTRIRTEIEHKKLNYADPDQDAQGHT